MKKNPAPPNAIDGSVSKSSIGVGAHQSHVNESDFATGFECIECHNKQGHFDTPCQQKSHLEKLHREKQKPKQPGIESLQNVQIFTAMEIY